MKTLLTCIFSAALIGGIVSLARDDAPAPTPGLDFVARANGATNSAAYLAKLQIDLNNQGLQQIESALYAAGNARSRELSVAHPRTRAAILRLLQLDGWYPDGSGAPPPAFDPSIADSRIATLATDVP